MNSTIELLARHARDSILMVDTGLDEVAAERLLNVHLNPRHFPMPIHDLVSEGLLIEFCRGSSDISGASDLLSLEPTRSIKGIARVLARTHMNRQGVSDVTRGAHGPRWKAQSPRVVNLFEGINTDDDLRQWLDYKTMINAWIALANRNSGDHAPDELRFDGGDIESLMALGDLSAAQARCAQASGVPGVTKMGWARVVLGLYTGLVYLDQRFGLSAARVWARLDAVRTARDVAELSADAQRHITEFGSALAPSFFADLGSEQFVKPDVHVVDVTSARSMSHSANHETSIAFVRQLASDVGWSPRKVDKLIYLACSANFYLAGIKLPKRDKDERKKLLMEALRR
jgi:hypothetical protein